MTKTEVGATLPEAAEPAREFPGWRIWRSDGGSWMAIRRRRLTDAEMCAGCYPTVHGDLPDGGTSLARLRQEMTEQRDIEQRVSG